MSSEPSSATLIIGAGGHGRVVLETLRLRGVSIDGFLDDGLSPGTLVDDLPVLGPLGWVEAQAFSGPLTVYVAIGQPRVREERVSWLTAAHRLVRFPTLLHPNAVVSPRAVLDEGSYAAAGAVIQPGARLGRFSILNTGSVIEHDARVDDFTTISAGSVVGALAKVGRGTWTDIGCRLAHRSQVAEGSNLKAGAVVL